MEYKATLPSKAGFYPVVWPGSNLLTIAEIPEGFSTKSPIVKTTHSGCFWSLEDLERMGVLWGSRIDIQTPQDTKRSKVKVKETRESRVDTEHQQDPPDLPKKKSRKAALDLDALL